MDEAVETLRPSESFSNLRSVSASKSLNNSNSLLNHPYSNAQQQQQNSSSTSLGSIDTVNGRTERLLRELDSVNNSSQFAGGALPPRPPSAFLHNHPLSSYSCPIPHHPLAPLSPIPDNSPAPSPIQSLVSTHFDPNRDLASAYALYPRTSQYSSASDPSHRPSPSSGTILTLDTYSLTSGSRDHLPKTGLDDHRQQQARTISPSGGSFSFDEEAKARAYEKKRGRQKLKWWSLFWLVVIAGIALGIGIAAAAKSKSKSNDGNEKGNQGGGSNTSATPSDQSNSIGTGGDGVRTSSDAPTTVSLSESSSQSSTFGSSNPPSSSPAVTPSPSSSRQRRTPHPGPTSSSQSSRLSSSSSRPSSKRQFALSIKTARRSSVDRMSSQSVSKIVSLKEAAR
ncbi:hypothetical protein JCM3765_002102 [Sporobolomyces pararoseus]